MMVPGGRLSVKRLVVHICSLAIVLVGAAALIVGCSGHSEPSKGESSAVVTTGADGVQHVAIVGDDKYMFVPDTFTVHPGKVEVTLTVTGSIPHDLRFTGALTASIPIITAGKSASVEFTVDKPGRYPFICTLHDALGMTGTMIVE
jgi:plastocyanin